MNLQTKRTQGWNGDTVFLNLTREYAERKHIYEALEILKDGFITCTKYTGGDCWIPKLHVIVFANFKPNLTSLSMDRWNIMEIREDKELHPVTLKRVQFKPMADDYEENENIKNFDWY